MIAGLAAVTALPSLAVGQVPTGRELPPSVNPSPTTLPPSGGIDPRITAEPVRPGTIQRDPGPIGSRDLVYLAPGEAPGNVRVTGTGPRSVTLSWSPPAGATRYWVFQQQGSDTAYYRGNSSTTDTTFTVNFLLPTTTYSYKVGASYPQEMQRREGLSSAVNATTSSAAAPEGLAGTVTGEGHVILTWNKLPGADGYRIHQNGAALADIRPMQFTSDAPPTLPTTYDAPVSPGTYGYQIQALYQAGNGEVISGLAPNQPVMVTVTPKPLPPIWGFADLHTHQFSNVGFGGWLLHGRSFGPIDVALARRSKAAPGADAIGAALGQGIFKSGKGYPEFDEWPGWYSITFQQMYVDWIRRAFDGGLKLMVVLASNNPVLCAVAAPVSGRTCDDMENVDAAINEARAMEAWVDARSGGPGKGWYRIVTSGRHAREVINSGKLAVVLGTEVPGLFGCRIGGGCTTSRVRHELQKYYDLGIRQITPVHNADNAFGGSALYNEAFNFSNKIITDNYFDTWNCSANGLTFRFGVPGGVVAQALIGVMTTAAFGPINGLIAGIGVGSYVPPAYPAGPHCNARGLTPLGDFMIREMMNRRMIVDIDHMSSRTFDATLNIVQSGAGPLPYPVVASHTGLVAISRTAHGQHEGNKTDDQLARLKQVGALVAPITHQGGLNDVGTAVPSVPHDCGNSSKTWAQAYLHTVRHMGGPVALGSDFNGFAGQPGPRFDRPGGAAESCGKETHAAQSRPVPYPFQIHGGTGSLGKSAAGTRTFDFNVDGLAHIGLLPDFVEDLKQVGVTPAQLEPLFRSAEAYVNLWERIDASSAPAPRLYQPRLDLTLEVGEYDYQTTESSVTVEARDAETGYQLQGTVAINGVQGTTGRAITFPACLGPNPDTGKVVGGQPCDGRVSVPGYPTASFTAGGA
jgi:microsomal dipeptidase-like Zn-dependent dipeptidase